MKKHKRGTKAKLIEIAIATHPEMSMRQIANYIRAEHGYSTSTGHICNVKS